MTICFYDSADTLKLIKDLGRGRQLNNRSPNFSSHYEQIK